MITIRRVLAAAAGILLGVLGGVALAQTGATGLDRHAEVAAFHSTGLMAWIQVGYALLLVGAAASWGAGGTTGFLGALGAAFGFVVLIADESLHDSLGVHSENGVLYLVVGSLVALFGFLTMGGAVPGERREGLA